MTTAVAANTKVKATISPRMPKVAVPPFNVITDTAGDRFVEITSSTLLAAVRDAARNMEGLWDKTPKVTVDDLFDELPDLKSHLQEYGKNTHLTRLIAFLEQEHEAEMARVTTMLENGVISFSALRLLLKPNTEILIQGDHAQGAKITECSYRHSPWGSSLEIEYEYVSSTGRALVNGQENISLGSYRGVRDINQMFIRPITAEQKAVLTARGRAYAKLALGAHYKQFTGHMEVMKWYSYSSMRATGRVMIDIATHNQFKDDRRRSRNENNNKTVPDQQLWMCEPYVAGFSFVTKQWGRFPVTQLTDIDFRSDAYDQLVLDPEKKVMVRALVEDSSSGFSDIISGKGGGCIFLLHGEPGVGKTLTAEAVSELLHRPLYSVSVGELGVNAQELEKNLRQILDVAQIWNAVILIDEADIFLEKRSTGDVVRNSLVSVFLRLLEYHQGVMFLTTNRVDEFDTAFHSRISVAMKYNALTETARDSIWQNLLAAAGIAGLDTQVLAKVNLNGRQIKNTIRLAQSLSRQEGTQLGADHIQRCLEVSQQFARDLKEE